MALSAHWHGIQSPAPTSRTAALSAIEAQLPLLRAGWEGPAADIFFADVDSDARPGMTRLVHALRHGADVSATMLRVLDDAEQAAARIDWSGGGVVAASSADDGAVVAPVREDGRRGGGGSDVKRGGGPSSVIDRRAALESSDLAAAPDESTQASSPELIVVDRAGPFTVYEDPATGERVLQVDLNAMVGLSEQQIVAYLNEIGLAGRTGIIFTSLHGQNVRNQSREFFAAEGLSTSAYLSNRYGDDAAGDIDSPSNHFAVSVVLNSATPDSAEARNRAEELAPEAAKFYKALRAANPEASIVVATHSMGCYLVEQMLVARHDGNRRLILGAGAIDLAILMQSAAPSPLNGDIGYVNHWQSLRMDNVETAPIDRVHWVYDIDDTALGLPPFDQGLPLAHTQGMTPYAAEGLVAARNFAVPGSGNDTVTSSEYNTEQNFGHGGLNPEDPATQKQFDDALQTHLDAMS